MSISQLLDSVVSPYEALNVYSIKTLYPPEVPNYSYINLGFLPNAAGATQINNGVTNTFIPMDWKVNDAHFYTYSSTNGNNIVSGSVPTGETRSSYAVIKKEGIYEINYSINGIYNAAQSGTNTYTTNQSNVEVYIYKNDNQLLQNSKVYFPTVTAPLVVEQMYLPNINGTFIGKFIVDDKINLHIQNACEYSINWNPSSAGAGELENLITIKYLG